MLQLRPSCEHCNTALPPESTEARICNFECTFCADCVDTVLSNVCPNCGGGFAPRPVRPARYWKGGNHLARHPASATVKHRPVDPSTHAALGRGCRGWRRKGADALGAYPPKTWSLGLSLTIPVKADSLHVLCFP